MMLLLLLIIWMKVEDGDNDDDDGYGANDVERVIMKSCDVSPVAMFLIDIFCICC